MIKRIFAILTYPFLLFYMLISFPFKIAKIIIDDKIEKRKNKTHSPKAGKNDILEIGQYLFPEFDSDYNAFINTYLANKNEFLSVNKDLFSKHKNFDLNKLKPIEAIYIFGDSKQKLILTDWRGEENEREIECFLEEKLQIKTEWKNVNKLRKNVDIETQNDSEFIIEILKAFDKDLIQLNRKLIFLDLKWDSYVYTVIDMPTFKTLTDKFSALFHGSDKLRY